jgi:predicted RNase H-like HicB family nuclease
MRLDSNHEGKCCATSQSTYISPRNRMNEMNLKAIVHEAEEGGFWAEVPAIPGCASQGDTMEELMVNLREAIEGCLSIDVANHTFNDRWFKVCL